MGFFSLSQDREPSPHNVLLRYTMLALSIAGVLAAPSGLAQQKTDFAGDYAGLLGPIHVKLHIVAAPDGSVSANVDSPDQNLFALSCADIGINGQTLSFSVPSIRGEWMGTLSADRATLSGIWKQGRPMPLNLTRISAASSATPGTPPPGADAPVTKPADVSQHPPCSSMLSITYWEGSAWKPMTIASHVGGDKGVSLKQGLKNPFNPRAGITSILTFKNQAAALTLERKPSFCVSLPPNLDPTVIMIGALDVKKDHRELETCTGMCASTARRSTDDWMPEKRVQPVDIRRLSDTAVEITPKAPLQPGQYILGGPGAAIGYYDFGVTAGGSSQ